MAQSKQTLQDTPCTSHLVLQEEATSHTSYTDNGRHRHIGRKANNNNTYGYIMKKNLVLLLTVIAALSGCMQNDLAEIRREQATLAARISAIEKWQALVNDNIAGLQSIINAQSDNDYVTSVTPLTDGSGYVINFVKSGAVTIRNGEQGIAGATPQISAKEDNGIYYWTLNGDYLRVDGKRLRVTGEPGATAPTPRLKTGSTLNSESGGSAYEADATYLSVDNGANWTKVTGPQGDAIFTTDGIDTDNDDYIELTLADGTTKIRLPRYKTFQIGTDTEHTNATISLTELATDIPLSLPSDLKADSYTAIMAQITSDRGTSTDIKTRAAALPWTVSVEHPTFDPTTGNCKNDAKVTVTAPEDIADGETAMLEVSIIGADGRKTIATRALKYTAIVNTGDYYYSDGTFSASLISSKTCIGVIFHVGDVAKDDAVLRAKIGDTSTGNHGLVVALKDAGKGVIWQTADAAIGDAGLSEPYVSILIAKTKDEDPDGNLNMMLGYNNTEVIKKYNKSNNGSKATILQSIDTYAASNTAPGKSSGWYLPSIKELSLIYSGVINGSIWDLGYDIPANTSNKTLIEKKFSTLNTQAAGSAENFSIRRNNDPSNNYLGYWSSSEAPEKHTANPNQDYFNRAWYGDFLDSYINQTYKNDDGRLCVRAILAF